MRRRRPDTTGEKREPSGGQARKMKDTSGDLPVEYVPRPWTEVIKLCGGTGPLGCTNPRFKADCNCKSIKPCWWFARPEAFLKGPIQIIYASDCDNPGGIIGHEKRHLRTYERSTKGVQESGLQLGRQRFRSKSSCEAACESWVDEAKRRLESRRRNDWIDRTRRPRGCSTFF